MTHPGLLSANERLLLHAGHEVRDDFPGLLEALRPFSHYPEREIADALRALVELHPQIAVSEHVERRLCGATWDLCRRMPLLTIDAETGGPRHSGITPRMVRQFAAWTLALESFAIRMYSGVELDACLSNTMEVAASDLVDDLGSFLFLLPLAEEMEQSEFEDLREIAAAARERLTVHNARGLADDEVASD